MKALILSELRQRVRRRRWWWLIVAWTLALFLLMIPIRLAGQNAQDFLYGPRPAPPLGPLMFGSLAILILGLSCLIVPSLSATAINGERDRGTLAVLQSTLLHPAEIVLAKFFSALIVSGAFLVASLPIAVWCLLEGGMSLLRAATVYLVLFVMSGVLTALALAASAFVRRPAMSAVLAYGAVGLLTIGTVILFTLAHATAPRGRYYEPQIGNRWIILAPNPFVVLADAAPRSRAALDDPLAGIQESIRYLREPEPIYIDGPGSQQPFPDQQAGPAVWPYGLAIDLSIAGLALASAISRLRVPVRRLAPGHRVA
jgi:ABC-2 type transport system permease protein